MSGCPKTNCKHSLTDLFLQLSGSGSASGGGGCGCGSGGSGSGNRRGRAAALCVVAPLNFLYARERLPKLSSCASFAVYLCVHTYTWVCVCVCDPYSQRHSGVKFMA